MGRIAPGRTPWRRPVLRMALAAATVGASLLASPGVRAMDGDRYGEVRLLIPEGDERDMVIMFSGSDGWSPADQAAAAALAKAGALVAGIDSRYYAGRLNEIDETCHVLIGDAEALSRQIQRLHGAHGYHAPILFGVGEGGALAEATLAQARANTIAGAVSVDTRLDPGTNKPACSDTKTLTVDPQAADRGPGPLQGFWTAAFRPGASPAERQKIARWATSGTVTDMQDLAAGMSPSDVALALVGPHLEAKPPAPSDDAVAALPLVELPAAHPTDQMAVVLSGDGGWRDIDKTVAEDMQASGVSVVGWDCLHYFWHAKTPDEVARDLATVLRTYSARWHARHIALVGYSFGADVLPFAFNRLPADLRAKVTLISLLGFTNAADFEISVTGWLGAPPTAAALPVAAEVNQIPRGLIQCFYGEGEDDSACPALATQGIEVIRTAGEHHFDGNYGALAHRIVAGLAGRSG